jgi:hypothetical protein
MQGTTSRMITIHAVSFPPANFHCVPGTFAPPSTPGMLIGNFTAESGNPAQAFTYAIIGGADAANFSLSNGRLTLNAGGVARALEVVIRATDGISSLEKTYRIPAVNVPPTDITLNATTYRSPSVMNQVVGTLGAVDPNPGQVHDFYVKGEARLPVGGSAVRYSSQAGAAGLPVDARESGSVSVPVVSPAACLVSTVAVYMLPPTTGVVVQLVVTGNSGGFVWDQWKDASQVYDWHTFTLATPLSVAAGQQLLVRVASVALGGTIQIRKTAAGGYWYQVNGAVPSQPLAPSTTRPTFSILGNELRVSAEGEARSPLQVTVVADDRNGGVFEKTLTIVAVPMAPATPKGIAVTNSIIPAGATAGTVIGTVVRDTPGVPGIPPVVSVVGGKDANKVAVVGQAMILTSACAFSLRTPPVPVPISP